MINGRFPSPCGVLVLKLSSSQSRYNREACFPSPCGVLVLKFIQTDDGMNITYLFSVPLRGSGS